MLTKPPQFLEDDDPPTIDVAKHYAECVKGTPLTERLLRPLRKGPLTCEEVALQANVPMRSQGEKVSFSNAIQELITSGKVVATRDGRLQLSEELQILVPATASMTSSGDEAISLLGSTKKTSK